MGTSPVTVTLSVTPPTLSVAEMLVFLSASTRLPVIDTDTKPLSVTVRSYRPSGNCAKTNLPLPSVTAVRVTPRSALDSLRAAPGSTPPVESTTVAVN